MMAASGIVDAVAITQATLYTEAFSFWGRAMVGQSSLLLKRRPTWPGNVETRGARLAADPEAGFTLCRAGMEESSAPKCLGGFSIFSFHPQQNSCKEAGLQKKVRQVLLQRPGLHKSTHEVKV